MIISNDYFDQLFNITYHGANRKPRQSTTHQDTALTAWQPHVVIVHHIKMDQNNLQ